MTLPATQARRTGEWEGRHRPPLRSDQSTRGSPNSSRPILDAGCRRQTVVGRSASTPARPGSRVISCAGKTGSLPSSSTRRMPRRSTRGLPTIVRVKTIALDGWLALGSFVPPKERRGLVLVDPPFEEKGEFDRLIDGFRTAYRRWPGAESTRSGIR